MGDQYPGGHRRRHRVYIPARSAPGTRIPMAVAGEPAGRAAVRIGGPAPVRPAGTSRSLPGPLGDPEWRAVPRCDRPPDGRRLRHRSGAVHRSVRCSSGGVRGRQSGGGLTRARAAGAHRGRETAWTAVGGDRRAARRVGGQGVRRGESDPAAAHRRPPHRGRAADLPHPFHCPAHGRSGHPMSGDITGRRPVGLASDDIRAGRAVAHDRMVFPAAGE